MIASELVYDALLDEGVTFFTGVPDSLLKPFCSCLYDRGHQLIPANEGSAVALAAGYHLATGGIPLVYLQNSGLGNAVNPLTSLTNPEVYGIPMVLMIGWRGEPGTKDEPQHQRPGAVMLDQLELLGIRPFVVDASIENVRELVSEAIAEARRKSCPIAFVVKEGTFLPYSPKGSLAQERFPGVDASALPAREEVLERILGSLSPKDLIVSTTGKTSREVYEIRARGGQTHAQDFLCVGNMGHASQIAMGIALNQPNRRVICLDGDGALLMHMGSLAIQGAHASENFYHVMLNNASHESVGGQPTVAGGVDWPAVALACGYCNARRSEGAADSQKTMEEFFNEPGPAFLEIRIRNGSRSDLGRPATTPEENKRAFMKNLGQKPPTQ